MKKRNGIRLEIGQSKYNEAVHDMNNHAMAVIHRLGAGAYISRHEILGILTEEYQEVVEAIHLGKINNEVIHELKDLAFACIWGIVSIKAGATEYDYFEEKVSDKTPETKG